MSSRSLAGWVALGVVVLLFGEPALRTRGPAEERARTGVAASSLASGVRLPVPSSARREPTGAFRFGPAAREERGPAERALEALADGRPDRAIAILERGSANGPDSRELRALSAAAHLARGLDAGNESPGDLVEALERIGREPDDLPSLYNRALALEALHCYRVAAQEWERYLERDPGSEWGAEAAERVVRLRELVTELDRGTGEGAGPPAVHASEAADAGPAAGRDGLREGLEALDRYEIERASGLLEATLSVLVTERDPRRWEAEEGLARVAYHRGHLDGSASRARQVRDVARSTGRLPLEARALRLLADIELSRLNLQAALDHASARLALAHRTGDRRLLASAEFVLSRVLDEMGAPEEAWTHRLASLRALAELRDGRNLALSIQNSSFALARQGKHSAAADFASEMLALDRVNDDPLGTVESLWIRAGNLARAGDLDGAARDVAEARTLLGRIDDERQRSYLEANLGMVEGDLLTRSDPGAAVEAFSRSLDALAGSEARYGRSEILLERAKALRRTGSLEAAGMDLEEAVRLVSHQRSAIDRPILRVGFFDLQVDLADEAVGVAVARGRGEEAFRLAESMKGVLLRESLGAGDDEPSASATPDAAWRPDLAAGDVMVSYWSLPGELLSWVVRPGEETKLRRLRVSRRDLAALENGFAGMARSGRRGDRLASGAYRALVEPLAADLSGSRRLIVVPDRFTRGIPWAALGSGEDGGPILDSTIVHVRPTAIGVAASALSGTAVSKRSRFLGVGDPWTAGRFSPLPAARAEVLEAASRFHEPVILVGRDASRERLLDELPGADVIELASHFTTDDAPGSTILVLASDASGGVSGLSVAEIVDLELPRRPLVILSGCATGREGEPTLEGTFAAAGAFLAAGAREVVFTLWPVDDRTTRALMSELHDRLEKGYPTDEALRDAQRAVAGSSDGSLRAGDWAAFQVLTMGASSGAAP